MTILTSFRTVLVFCLLATMNFCSSCSNNESQEKAQSKDSSVQKNEVKNTQACSLLTEADAKQILGNAIQPGMQSSTMCQYVSASEELSKTGENVSLTFHQNAGSEYEKYVSDMEKSTGTTTEPVQGVGEKAAWADGSLIVKQGDDLLVIIVGKKMEKAKHINAAKSLANSILSRM